MRKFLKMCLLILVALIAKPTMGQTTISSVIASNTQYRKFLKCEQEYVNFGCADSRANYKLLIICAEPLINDIKAYVNYKIYQGYKVALVSSKAKVGTEIIDVEMMHSFLRDDISKRNLSKNDAPLRPDYVLLVGSTYSPKNDFIINSITDNFIPFHGNPDGDLGRTQNPANDFTYSIKDGSIENGLLYHIGRFNVNNSADLERVIYQTMAAEQNYNCMKKHVLKVTGMGLHDIETRWIPTHTATLTVKDGAIESMFEDEQTARYIKTLIYGIKIGEFDLDEMDIAQILLDHIEFHGIAEDHCDRVGDSVGFIERVRKQPHLLLLYNGHGSAYTNFPYEGKEHAHWHDWCDSSKVKNDTIFPMFFSQACANGAYAQINKYEATSFGHDVVTNCCSAFIGASTTTGARWGQLFVKWAFKGKSWSTKEKNESAWEKKEHIGDFLDYAKKKAFDEKDLTIFKLSNQYSACKRFNLFGDPSLFIRGFNITSLKFQNECYTNNNKIYYKVLSNIDTNNKSVVANSGSELKLIAGEKISLKQGFKVEKGATFKAEIQKGLPLNN